MGERWVGIVVSSTGLILICLDFASEDETVLVEDNTWKLQTGELPDAYRVMYERVLHYIRENGVNRVVIKGTSTNSRGITGANLKAAELRGVIIAAVAQSGVPVDVTLKAKVSRSFGSRKADAYMEDDSFWSRQISSGKPLRVASREAALIVFAARQP